MSCRNGINRFKGTISRVHTTAIRETDLLSKYFFTVPFLHLLTLPNSLQASLPFVWSRRVNNFSHFIHWIFNYLPPWKICTHAHTRAHNKIPWLARCLFYFLLCSFHFSIKLTSRYFPISFYLFRFFFPWITLYIDKRRKKIREKRIRSLTFSGCVSK